MAALGSTTPKTEATLKVTPALLRSATRRTRARVMTEPPAEGTNDPQPAASKASYFGACERASPMPERATLTPERRTVMTTKIIVEEKEDEAEVSTLAPDEVL